MRAEARDGLVYGPYLTERRAPSLISARGGACTKLRRPFARPRRQPPHATRGKVREFTRRSRTRLQQTLCAMPVAHVGRGLLFVTLTYPREWPGSWPVWKRHLDTMAKRLARKFGAFGAVWKLEPQRRGAPHFHLLVVGVPFIAKAWLSQAWYEVVRSRDPRHLAAGTQVQLARSHRGVVSYAAKYTAKYQALPESWQEGVGRWWGVYGRKNLGIVWLWAPLTQPQYWMAARVCRSLVAHRQRSRGRSPPRPAHFGAWLVLREAEARRVLACVRDNDHIGPQGEPHGYIAHPGQGADCPACSRSADSSADPASLAAPRP